MGGCCARATDDDDADADVDHLAPEQVSRYCLSVCLFVVGKDFVAAREAREQRKEKEAHRETGETGDGEVFVFFVFPKSKRRWSSRTRALEDRWGGAQMRRHQRGPPASLATRTADWVSSMLRNAEFEILFILFFVIAFLLFKDLV